MFRTEPAILVSSIVAFLTAAIGLGVAFGMDLSDQQQTAIISVVAPLVGVVFLLGPIIRGLVYAPDTHADAVQQAHDAGVQNEVLQVPKA